MWTSQKKWFSFTIPRRVQILINPRVDFHRHRLKCWMWSGEIFALEIIEREMQKNRILWCNFFLLFALERRALTFIAFNLFKLMGFCKALGCCHTQPSHSKTRWFFAALALSLLPSKSAHWGKSASMKLHVFSVSPACKCIRFGNCLRRHFNWLCGTRFLFSGTLKAI